MKKQFRHKNGLLAFILVPVFLLIASCAPKVSFTVTKPSKLKVDQVEIIAMGNFNDELNQDIPFPKDDKNKETKRNKKKDGGVVPVNKPSIKQFRSNNKAGDIVRAQLVSALSREKHYQLVNTGGSTGVKGIYLKPEVTAVVNAKIRYYEYTLESSEKKFYTLMLTNNNLDPKTALLLEGIKLAAVEAAESSKKGFMEPTPFVEKVGAMEVEFSLVRKSTGETIVPPQTFQSYYAGKWGGESETSALPLRVKDIILRSNQAFLRQRSGLAGKMKIGLIDPTDFIAFGGNLKSDETVPETTLGIKILLARIVAQKYLEMISSYSEVTSLEIQGGDSIAENYMRGSAFEKAINRLEGLPEKSVEDIYNLALAYESIGENHQAEKYYQDALQQEPDEELYQTALERVKR